MEKQIETENIEKIVPSLTLDSENKVILQTVEVPLMINKEKKIIKIQEIPAGKRRELSKKYLNPKIQGQQLTGTPDGPGFQIGILASAIIEAPFETTEATLSKFPGKVLDYLYSEYNKEFGQDEKKNK